MKLNGKKSQRVHTINTEGVGEAFLLGGFDEFKTLRENLESTFHLIYGIVSLSVSTSEACERESATTLTDHLKELILHV